MKLDSRSYSPVLAVAEPHSHKEVDMYGRKKKEDPAKKKLKEMKAKAGGTGNGKSKGSY